MACLVRCCSCCCPNGQCPCLGKTREEKYPHIEYYEPGKASETTQVPEKAYHKIPLEKIFEFPQESQEFRLHPQIGRRSLSSHVLVTQQPMSSEMDVQPMYVTGRGRSIGTISELPHLPDTSMSESPPFTPPFGTAERKGFEYPGSPSAGKGETSVKLTLYYDIQRRTLTVHILCACNLPPRDMWGTLESYVTLFLLPSRDTVHQTRIVSETSNPLFNQNFEFRGILSEEVYEQVLVIQLYFHDKLTRDHLIGTVGVPLKEADLFGVEMTKRIGDGTELLQVNSILQICGCLD